MEKITFRANHSKKKEIKVYYRLRDGRSVQLCHRTDILANVADLEKLNPDGTRKDRVKNVNVELSEKLKSEFAIMTKAYALMKSKRKDMTSAVFEHEIGWLKDPVEQDREGKPSIVTRFRQYADDALRGCILGDARHKHILVVADKLERFLIIKGFSRITAQEFNETYLMEFRNFLFDEYLFIEKYPAVYKKVSDRNKPRERLSMNTVASQLKMFQTFFNELENTDEIHKSPFRKMGRERRKTIMKTLYDAPYFLRKEELLRIIETEVPASLADTKDAFLVQCAFGCRISDFQKMDLETIAVSEEGIPYIHYIPQKTVDLQIDNTEVQTPVVRFAFDIIKRTGFSFPVIRNVYGKSGYNVSIKSLLNVCGIDRKVAQFNEKTKRNDYVPLSSVGSSKLARKTHVDLMNKVQINQYVAGLHKEGSNAVNRYMALEIKDRFDLMNAAFDQEPYRVNDALDISFELAGRDCAAHVCG